MDQQRKPRNNIVHIPSRARARTSVTFFTLFALMPRSPAAFALIVASFTKLHAVSYQTPKPTHTEAEGSV